MIVDYVDKPGQKLIVGKVDRIKALRIKQKQPLKDLKIGNIIFPKLMYNLFNI
jgi:hypothetical protein